MESQTDQNSFGKYWGLMGTLEKSYVQAVVGGISTDSGLSIGLTAMQLENIGDRYGPVSVQLHEEDPTPVEAYNIFGVNSQNGSKIWISRSLAERMELREGEVLKVHRVLDEQGRIKYRCENQKDNPLGQSWYITEPPAEGIVAAIDDDKLDMVGLSARQIRNLNVENGEDLVVEFGGQKKPARVYNAFGMKAVGGCGVRISSTLARDLGLKLEDKVNLY